MLQNLTQLSVNASPNIINDSLVNQNVTESLPLLQLPLYLIVIYSVGYSAIFFFTFFGNLMVIAVVYKNERMHTATNYFIANLAFADFLVAIFNVPFTLLDSIFTGWRFGAFMCKATLFLQGVSVCASVTTLAAIAIDRYLAICYLFQVKITGRICRIIIVNIWVVALGVSVPWAVYHKQLVYSPEIFVCYSVWPSPESRKAYFLGATVLVCYAIPLLVISVCYGMIGYRVWNRNAPGISNTSGVIYKSKVKAIKMMLVVFVLFFFSWLPLYSIHLWVFFGPMSNNSGENSIVYTVLMPIAQWLGSSNSGMNPVIYCFYSKKFRRGFKSLLTCCSSSRLNRDRSQFSTTKYMTVDYDNGHFKVSFRKEVQEDDSSSRNYV